MRATESLDDLAMLRAGVRFAQRVGRAPKRLDFREPARSDWEQKTGLELPSADAAARRFGGWNAYLARLGYTPSSASSINQEVEQAALAHCEDVYPELDLVESEQNAYDAYVDAGQGPEKTEIKGSALAARSKRAPLDALYFSFRTHGRDLSSTVDRAIFVGVGRNPESGILEPLVRLEFPKRGLRVIDGKGTVMVYASSIFFGGMSRYSPYIRWRKPGLKTTRLLQYARTKEDS